VTADPELRLLTIELDDLGAGGEPGAETGPSGIRGFRRGR
jgi:hypothetical protein